MKELRERIANIVWERLASNCGENPETAVDAFLASDSILALIPKPTVRVKCDKCGGNGERVACGRENCEGCMAPQDCEQAGIYKPCTCTDGCNGHEIVWEWLVHLEPKFRTLKLTDLIDPDVAWAYGVLSEDAKLHGDRQRDIRNNKGTLRIGEKA